MEASAIARLNAFLMEYFKLTLSFFFHTVPPGLPRLSEERNVVNVRQGTEQVILAILGHLSNCGLSLGYGLTRNQARKGRSWPWRIEGNLRSEFSKLA